MRRFREFAFFALLLVFLSGNWCHWDKCRILWNTCREVSSFSRLVFTGKCTTHTFNPSLNVGAIQLDVERFLWSGSHTIFLWQLGLIRFDWLISSAFEPEEWGRSMAAMVPITGSCRIFTIRWTSSSLCCTVLPDYSFPQILVSFGPVWCHFVAFMTGSWVQVVPQKEAKTFERFSCCQIW